jgi:hypothetical protein
MRLQGCVSIIATVALLAGCPGMSKRDNERFQAVVAKNVSSGMSFVTGIEHLVRAGFSCDDRTNLGACRYLLARPHELASIHVRSKGPSNDRCGAKDHCGSDSETDWLCGTLGNQSHVILRSAALS